MNWMLYYAHRRQVEIAVSDAIDRHYRALLDREPTEYPTAVHAGRAAAFEVATGGSNE